MKSLVRLHNDSIYRVRRYRQSLEFWRKQSMAKILRSLQPNPDDPAEREILRVRDNGTVMQGNTRIKVLQERGYNVDLLPRFPAG